MKEITLQLSGGRSSRIFIGDGAVSRLPEPKGKRLLVTDSHVRELQPEPCRAFHADMIHVLPAGEEHKTFSAVEEICRTAARGELDRGGEFLAWGGGVTGDLTGFAAAVYLRGVAFRQVPTSLLAMVDSSVGGKTGADLPEGKNLIGAFWQPQTVHIDTVFLRTLPPAELRNGLGEVVKMAAGFDAGFFARLEKIAPACRDTAGFLPHAGEVVEFCVRRKAEVVMADERESGCRALLNYGHTFGHAVELASSFRVPHGAAVAIGMAAAGELALGLGLWSANDCARVRNLLRTLQLPDRLPAGSDPRKLLELMHRDKKNRNGAITVVLPRALGRLEVFPGLPEAEIRKAWEAIL